MIPRRPAAPASAPAYPTQAGLLSDETALRLALGVVAASALLLGGMPASARAQELMGRIRVVEPSLPPSAGSATRPQIGPAGIPPPPGSSTAARPAIPLPGEPAPILPPISATPARPQGQLVGDVAIPELPSKVVPEEPLPGVR